MSENSRAAGVFVVASSAPSRLVATVVGVVRRGRALVELGCFEADPDFLVDEMNCRLRLSVRHDLMASLIGCMSVSMQAALLMTEGSEQAHEVPEVQVEVQSPRPREGKACVVITEWIVAYGLSECDRQEEQRLIRLHVDIVRITLKAWVEALARLAVRGA